MRRWSDRFGLGTSGSLWRASVIVALALAGCNGEQGFGGPAPPQEVEAPLPVATAGPTGIGVILPLTGSNAALGQSMLNAIRLAAGSAPLDVQDTHGTPAGALAAASHVVAAHDGIILGPLTAAETSAAASAAMPAGVPILAFTSDVGEAKPGVWVLGLTPAQQVVRLVGAARSEGRSKFAAFLPENALGDAMAASLTEEAGGAVVGRHAQGFSSINDGMKQLSAFDSRHPNEAAMKADRSSSDPAVRAQVETLAAAPVPPLPFDALLLGDTGTQLQEVLDLLHPYDVEQSQVRIMGPALWGAFAQKLGQIAGAWYAAPDPSARAGFVAAFTARYHTSPLRIDDLAYDVGALASALSGHGGYEMDQLTRADGFAGTDGVFVLEPNGRVQRGLAVFHIHPGGGAHSASPAPARLDRGV